MMEREQNRTERNGKIHIENITDPTEDRRT